MSLKGLFEDISLTKIVADKSAAEIGDVVESVSYHEADIIDEKRFFPEIDFSKPKSFAKYGSAEKYYEDSFTYIHSLYPYDGSLAEKLQWRNSGSYIDLHLFDNEYPRSTGYINLSYPTWGSLTGSLSDGYGLSEDVEYISLKGGPGLGAGLHDQSANVWDPDNNRESNLEIDLTEGVTVEFWLNKSAFNSSNTEKEVVLDVWNNEPSSSADYGRLRIELTGAASGPSWLVTLMSGTTGVQWQTIGDTENATVTDGTWHHYAFSFLSASSGVTTKTYLDGDLKLTETVGTAGINKIKGSMEAYIGALRTSASGSSATTGYGKLSASVDEFRYWKTQRSSEKIGRYWNDQVGGGTNTDISNTNLGVYYKFNEGIFGTTSVDSTVLDYSGRVTNGNWEGYSSGARNTGSAFVSSSAAKVEFPDPIMYATHPDVVSKLSELKLSGSVHDFENTSQLFSFFPSWMQERDSDNGDELKKMTQIMSSYFDNLYLQLESFSDLKDVSYISGSAIKESTLTSRLLANKGFVAPELFADADILEQLANRNDDIFFRDNLSNIKNKIYQNIYNNLVNIYKAKGTRQSFRNLIRCFGIDEKIYRLNAYGNNIEFKVRENRELRTVKKNYIDFSQTTRFGSTVFQTSSSDLNTVSYLSASSELTGGFASTLEAHVLFPKKPEPFQNSYSDFRFTSLTSSLFGRHTVEPSSPNELTWATTDSANYQVYAVRDEVMSNDVRFILTSSAGSALPELTSSYYQDVYNNTNWIFAVTIKPTQYPLVSFISDSSTTSYTIEFKGTHVDSGVVVDSFTITGSYDASVDGYGPITGSTRVYLGAHRQDFEGTVLQESDVRMGFCRYWLDDIEMETLQSHGKDILNYGTSRPSSSPFLFQANQDLNIDIRRGDTLALNWDFQTVSTSDASGEFEVPDFSSGSTAIQSGRFGFLGNLLGAQHTAQGYGFPNNATEVIDADYNISAELLSFEKLTSEDMIEVLNVQDDIQFTKESRPINFLFAIEKSMYATISEEMIKTFAAIADFNNIVGQPVNKYRPEYKELRSLREKFFEKVGNTPDLDKYVEYYKWFDSALSKMLEQLIPASAEFPEGIQNVIESHVLERSKYQHKFPTLEYKGDDAEGYTESPLPLSPGWGHTHHPVNDQENTNANWWLTRAARDKDKLASGITAIDNDRQALFESAILDSKSRKEKQLYRFISNKQRTVEAGANFGDNKISNYVFSATAPWGPVIAGTNIPKNVILSFDTNIQDEQDIVDDLTPGQKKKIKYTVDAGINRDLSDKHKGHTVMPFNMFSASATTDYSSQISSSFRANITITNLHEDIVGTQGTRPLQGPFTEKFVGGRQYRHTELNDGTDTRESRAEGFRIALGLESTASAPSGAVGALAIVPPNYPFLDSPSGSAPHGYLPELKTAHRLRDESAKRPVNIKNILMTTSPLETRISGAIVHSNIGNYTKNYQVVQTSGRSINDLFYRRQTFTFAPYPETLATRGRFPLSVLSTAMSGGNLDYELPDRSGDNSNKTVIVNKFSAPGSYETISRGYLDPAHEEKSVYNVLTYRNLSVLNYGRSESSSVDPTTTGSIVVQDQLNKPRGLRQLLSLHSGRFGVDAEYGVYPTDGYPTTPSFHKVNRNRKRRLENDVVITGSTYDNAYVTHPLPRSTQQYSWITASLSSGSSIFGYTTLSGGIFTPSLSTITSPDDYTDETFSHCNIRLIDPVTSSTNTLGFALTSPTSSYTNPSFWDTPVFNNLEDMFNLLMLRRSGPYQHPSWKQIRMSDHPILATHRNNNTYSIVVRNADDVSNGSLRGNTLRHFTEPVVYSDQAPMRHTFNYGDLNLTLKNTYGNKLIHFADYELDRLENTKKDYQSSDLYFNRINSLIEKKQNNDRSVSSEVTQISAVYEQRIYPAAYNAYLNRTRTRTDYSIAGIWDSVRAERAIQTTFTTEQGGEISDTPWPAGETSTWPLDAHRLYSTTSSVQSASTTAQLIPDGAGTLQNQYSRYYINSESGTRSIYPSAVYASRIPLGATASHPVFGGDQLWDAPTQAGKQPYQTYEEYAKNIRLLGKDYSLVPEFRISEHLDSYLESGDFTTLTGIDDILELTGTAYQNSSEPNFFKEYANSDFMKFFEVVDTAYEGIELVDDTIMSKKSVGLKCSALLKFLPYKGFYPAERSLELSTIFSQSYGDSIRTGTSLIDYRAILEPLFSPGIMFNTIKSGLAVSNFVLLNTASNASATSAKSVEQIFNDYTASVTSLPEGTLRFEGGLFFSSSNMDGTHHDDAGYFPQKLPFEAIYRPSGYLSSNYLSSSDGFIYDTGVGSASIEVATGTYNNFAAWSGGGKENYNLAIDNFLCETLNFFGNGLTSVTSEREENFKTVMSGTTYKMTFKLYRPLDTTTRLPDYDKFDPYKRQSAFGTPLLSYADPSAYSASYSHLTPAYFDGTGTATFTYTADTTGRPTLDAVMSNTTIEYDRDEVSPLYSALSTPYSSSIRMEVEDSFNLKEVINSVPKQTNSLKRQWLIQSKFETPILNFSDATASATPPATDVAAPQTPADQISGSGMWHTYGKLPSGDAGAFAMVEGTEEGEIKSLADIIGMPTGQALRLGEVKSRSVLEEAVVAIPFFVAEDGRRKFYKLDAEVPTDTLEQHMRKYVFPPRFDFVINADMDKIAMYVFEFSARMSQKDISDIWQNLPPSLEQSFEKKVAVVQHDLLADQMLNKTNRPLRKNLRWLVFKVKKRAAKDFTKFVKRGLVDDIDRVPSNINNRDYTYNWPYDYFSLVELIKIDEAIEYGSEPPPPAKVEIIGSVEVQIPDTISVRTDSD